MSGNLHICVLFDQMLCQRCWSTVKEEMRERGEPQSDMKCMRVYDEDVGWGWWMEEKMGWRICSERERERENRDCLTSAESRPHPSPAVQTHTHTNMVNLLASVNSKYWEHTRVRLVVFFTTLWSHRSDESHMWVIKCTPASSCCVKWNLEFNW